MWDDPVIALQPECQQRPRDRMSASRTLRSLWNQLCNRERENVIHSTARLVGETDMKSLVMNLPTFGFAVATRAALGAGIGLLLSERIPAEQRRRLGLALVMIGAATTVPILLSVWRGAD